MRPGLRLRQTAGTDRGAARIIAGGRAPRSPHRLLPRRPAAEVGSTVDLATEEGLRQALRELQRTGSWVGPAGHSLLTEIRRRAVRNAAHVAAAAGVTTDRGLVDDVSTAAWLVLDQYADAVLAAQRPWAYLMSSAQRHVADEVRAQQLLTNSAKVRGRSREILPRWVRPIGSTSAELATAFRHEPAGTYADLMVDIRIQRVSQHDQPPLIDPPPEAQNRPPLRERDPWFVAFIDLLVAHGADQTVTVAAVDRLADLLLATSPGWWECAARRDPVLAENGLSPDQCGALVALLAGSRRYRHNGKRDSVLAAVRTAADSNQRLELSATQLRRLAIYTGSNPVRRMRQRIQTSHDGVALARRPTAISAPTA